MTARLARDVRAVTGALLCAVTLAAVVGCGSDSADPGAARSGTVVNSGSAADGLDQLSPFTPAAAGTLTGSALTSDQLHRAALSVSDLPADFVRTPDPVEDLGLPPAAETSSTDKSKTDPAVCAAVLAPISAQIPGSVADASDLFTGPNFASIDQDSASFADGAAASQAFDALQQTVSGCPQYTGTDADGTSVAYRVGVAPTSGAPAPRVGDASFSFRIVTESSGFTLVSDVIVVAVGSTLTQISATAPSPIAPQVLADVATAAAGKLAMP